MDEEEEVKVSTRFNKDVVVIKKKYSDGYPGNYSREDTLQVGATAEGTLGLFISNWDLEEPEDSEIASIYLGVPETVTVIAHILNKVDQSILEAAVAKSKRYTALVEKED